MRLVLSENQINYILEETSGESILIVGDSHSVPGGFTWASKLQNQKDNVKNLSVGGKRTSWMLSQLESALSSKHYDKVIIWGGTNDMFSSVSVGSAISNIQSMVDKVNNQGGTAFVIVGYDANKFQIPYTTFMNTDEYKKAHENKVEKYNVTPEQKEEMRQKYIKFQDELSSSIKNAIIIPKFDLDHSYTSDNIHGNSAAHNYVLNIVSDYLDKSPSKKKEETKPINLTTEQKVLRGLKKFYKKGEILKYEESKINEVNKSIWDLQYALQFLGYYDKKIDGKFTKFTRKAIGKFQTDIGNPKTGNYKPSEIEPLLLKLKEKSFLKKSHTPIIGDNELVTNNQTVIKTGDSFGRIPINWPYTYPSVDNMEKRLKEIVGDEFYNKFISDCVSIGISKPIVLKHLYSESGYKNEVINCSRKSSAGAMGIAQFMPGTWPSYGTGDPCNPKDALPAYVKFMDHLIKKFNGRLDISIAAYNSGPDYPCYSDAAKNGTNFVDIKRGVKKINGKIAKDSGYPTSTYHYTMRILEG